MGGGGFGVLEQIAVLVALGRQMAAVPYLESVVLAAGALAKFGSEALQQRVGGAGDQRARRSSPSRSTARWVKGPVQATGQRRRLPADRHRAPRSATARSPTRSWCPPKPIRASTVFLVAADDAGVTVDLADTTGHGSVGHLELQGVEVDADRRRRAATERRRLADHPRHVGPQRFQLGVLERALELTAEYAREREQFDRPIGSFQAVASAAGRRLHRRQGPAADADPGGVAAVRGPARRREVGTAAFWAADAGHRVAHTAVHVHGGVGIDTDHPVHRYFLAAKQTEFAVGGATGQLLRIGRELADTPA